jgi:hypothetical protein
MRGLIFILGLAAFLVGSRATSGGALESLQRWIHNWFEETHSSRFELRRHFFRRFFDSELISDPNQAKVVAGGVIAIVLSLSVVYTQAYYHKYRLLDLLPDSGPYNRAALADLLFVITMAMTLVALLTTLQWPSLFPGLRDYLALAALPLRMRELFIAKFTALVVFMSLAIAATTALPSIVLPTVMGGNYGTQLIRQVPGIFLSASMAGFFVFFTLVTVQGVLLNVLPARQFPRVSLALQGVLLSVFLCALPLIFSIPDLHPYMDLRPTWAIWVPPLWFLGMDQVIAGHWEPLAARLAGLAFASVAASATTATLSYLWSYRRHRTRVIESPGTEGSSAQRASMQAWTATAASRVLPDLRSLAVFGFVAKSLARSRQHRLILTGFAAIALAVICEGFASLRLEGGAFQRASFHEGPFRQAVIAVPLALSLFMLAGLLYLFRLPVELRANWIFRIHAPGNAPSLLAGVESFVLFWGVFPVALLTLPVELALLGPRAGLQASLLCLLASLVLMELLLFPFERIPFTSSYFPGQDPVIVTVLKYSLASAAYVGALSGFIGLALDRPRWITFLLLILVAAWGRARSARLSSRQLVRLEFEELAEPAVQLLGIDRD